MPASPENDSPHGPQIARRGTDLEIRISVSGSWMENCYLLFSKNSRAAVVIDPGSNLSGIAAMLSETRAEVLGILLTHAHYDHIDGLSDVATFTGAPVYLHKDDLPLLRSANTFALGWKLPRIRIRQPDVLLRGEEQLHFRDLQVEVWHLPGHTPGSVGYAVDSRLFIGDTILPSGTGRVDIFGGEPAALEESVRRVISRINGSTVLYPGHGDAMDLQSLRRNKLHGNRCAHDSGRMSRSASTHLSERDS